MLTAQGRARNSQLAGLLALAALATSWPASPLARDQDSAAESLPSHQVQVEGEDGEREDDHGEDEPAPLAAGWMVEVQPEGQAPQTCVAPSPVLWGRDAGLLLPPGLALPARIEWKGSLVADQPGEYRIGLYDSSHPGASGSQFELILGDQPLAPLARSDWGTGWTTFEPVVLEFGPASIQLIWTGAIDSARRLSIAWEGPGFLREPVPARAMQHQSLGDSEPPNLRRGAQLARELRCAACHSWPGSGPALPAPELRQAGRWLKRPWLVDWLAPSDAAKQRPQAPSVTTATDRAMPHLGLSRADAQDLAAWLAADTVSGRHSPAPLGGAGQGGTPTATVHEEANPAPAGARPKPAPPSGKTKPTTRETTNEPPQGENLLLTLGCLACHGYQSLGNRGLLAGPDLSTIGRKRPAEFFSVWLTSPERINAAHRMPVFPLSDPEREALALWLTQTGGTAETAAASGTALPLEPLPRPAPTGVGAGEIDTEAIGSPEPGTEEIGTETIDPSVVERARHLAERHRCAACHAGLPLGDAQREGSSRSDESADTNAPTKQPFSTRTNFQTGCVATQPVPGLPHYQLASGDHQALTAYFAAMLRGNSPSHPPSPPSAGASPARGAAAPPSGEQLLDDKMCTACHARDLEPGLRHQLGSLAAAHPELSAQLPALAPPSLTSVGDKLTTQALDDAIARPPQPARRPWLAVRMPRYAWTDAERAELVRYLQAVDRLPGETPAVAEPISPGLPSPAELQMAGARLVTSDGFGCTSCHAIGRVAPEKVTLANQGTDLSRLGERIRLSWFQRWLRNPARLVPQLEMPSIQIPVRGVLEHNLEHQLSAVWQVLNTPGFDPPPPSPIRVVRRRNDADSSQRALVLTDVLRIGNTKLVRPLLVGLPNRQNVLFDLAAARWTAWWLGDTAQQRTKGKTWYWQPGAAPLLLHAGGQSHWRLLPSAAGPGNAASLLAPGAEGAPAARLDGWSHRDGGIELAYRLSIATGTERLLHVTDRITPLAGNDRSGGWRRQTRVVGLAAGELLGLTVWGPGAEPGTQGRALAPDQPLVLDTLLGQVTLVQPESAQRRPWQQSGASYEAVLAAGDDGGASLTVDYWLATPADQYLAPELETPRPQPVELAGFPGFQAVRLPLSDEEMPTGLAWRDDGTLLVSSLKGRVLWARDTDGDGLEDTSGILSDELACPYGLASARDSEGRPVVDVINKYALLRLLDLDGDDRADQTQVLADGWGYTDDYHDWAVGLPRDRQGNYYVSLACQQDRRTAAEWQGRGTVVRLEPVADASSGARAYRVLPFCAGLRFPMGLALDRAERLWASDNQGNYTPFNELNLLQPGRHYGFLNDWEKRRVAPPGSPGPSAAGSRPEPAGQPPPAEPPTVAIPHPWTRSVNGIAWLNTPPDVLAQQGPRFGPLEGQLLACEYDTRRLVRISIDLVGEVPQGAVYPLSQPPQADVDNEGPLGPLVCQVAPDGDLYVGSIRDSAWGGGSNTGELIRLVPTGQWPLGIAQIRALADGFQIEFTRPLAAGRGHDAAHYRIESFRRQATPDYGGPDLDRAAAKVTQVRLAADRRTVQLRVEPMRPGFVYQFQLRELSTPGEEFFPAEAFYTLHAVPMSGSAAAGQAEPAPGAGP